MGHGEALTCTRCSALGSRTAWRSISLRSGQGTVGDPERASRRAVFRLATRAVPKPIREVVWLLRGLQERILRQR